jgi:hypothetical protein
MESMNKTRPPTEYEGPTINGHPALSAENVQQWFNQACGHVPPLEDAARVARGVNHYDLFGALWKDTQEFKSRRRNNPSALRIARISKALTTLQNDLPVLIEDTRKVFPDPQGSRLITAVALLDAVNSVAPRDPVVRRVETALSRSVTAPLRQGPGRKPAGWHYIAQELGPIVLDALKSSNVRTAGFGKPTSPAVKIMKLVLDYLGVATSPEAIVEAMRRRPKRRKKEGGEIAPAKFQTSPPR